MSDRSTREQIVGAADSLFYHQGFEHTSFAKISHVVGISRGNFYHHFKSKDQILDAVIKDRLAQTQQMLEQWEVVGASPRERIGSFIDILIANRDDIQRYGCPVGTLCSELAKLQHAARDEASHLFTLFRLWLTRQFEQMGRAADADDLAMHLLARSQGVATLANAFNDEGFIRREVAALHDWLDLCARNAASAPSATPPHQSNC